MDRKVYLTMPAFRVGRPAYVPPTEALSPRRIGNAIALAAQCFSSQGSVKRMPSRTKHAVKTNETADWNLEIPFTR